MAGAPASPKFGRGGGAQRGRPILVVNAKPVVRVDGAWGVGGSDNAGGHWRRIGADAPRVKSKDDKQGVGNSISIAESFDLSIQNRGGGRHDPARQNPHRITIINCGLIGTEAVAGVRRWVRQKKTDLAPASPWHR